MKHESAVELFYDGAWNSAPILTRDEITINRGNPSTATLTIDNVSKNYSPRSVAGDLFGKIGQNTPIRILCELDPLHEDNFTRTVSDGWGYSPTAGGYYSAWSSGSLADFSVSGGAGNHVVTTAGSSRMSYLVGQVNTDDGDVECYVSCPLPTGGDLEPCILLAVQGTSDYYMFRARITTAGAVELQLRSLIGGVETLVATQSTSITHAAATPLGLRARMSCGMLEFKAWQGSTQPSTWQLTVFDTTISRRGGIGFRSGRGGGNTNVNAQFSYDAVRITIGRTRFVGEVTSWIPERPVKGSGWTRITASGVRQRLGRGVDPLNSSQRRYMETKSEAIAYWAMEPGSRSTNLVDPLNPLQHSGTDIEYAAFDGPAGSDKGPKFLVFDDRPPVTQIYAPVQGTSVEWIVNLWFRASPGSYSDVFFTPVIDLMEVVTDGSVARWTVEALSYPAGPQFEVTANGYDTAGDIISGLSAVVDVDLLDGAWHMISLQCQQIAGPFATVALTIDAGSGAADATGSYTNGRVQGVYLPKRVDPSNVTDVSMMHLAVFDSTDPSMYDLWFAGVGWTGEEAGTRFLRICEEQGVLAFVDGDATDTVSMGPQRLLRFLEHMDEVERTDDAWIYEPRAVLGLGMKTGQAKLNQTSKLTLDYEGKMIAPTLRPVVGDAHIRNDVTASNPKAGERRVEIATGPNSIAEVGRYQTRVDVNRGTSDGPDDASLVDSAGWRTNKGTFAGTWYAAVTVDLDAAPDMIPAVAAIDIGDLITLENLPEDEALEAVEHLVPSYVETLGNNRRRITFNLEPGEPYRVGVIGSTSGDTRDFLGWLDTDSAEVDTAVASAASSFNVTTPSGPLWSVDTDDFPQDVIVGGQEVSVSAVRPTINDPFTRTTSNGWGSEPSSGVAWSVSGTASDYSTNGTTARMSNAAVPVFNRASLLVSIRDFDITVTFTIAAAVTGAGGQADISLRTRYVDSTHLCDILIFRSPTNVTWTIHYRDGATDVNAGFPAISGATSASSITVRFKGNGTSIYGWAYVTGTTPPTDPMLTIDDVSHVVAGTLELNTSLNASVTNALPLVTGFDDFVSATPQTFTVQVGGSQVAYDIPAGQPVNVAHPIILTQ